MEGKEATDQIGKMIAFHLYLNLLFRPLRVIADKFNVLQMGMVASERVFKVLDNDDFIHPSEAVLMHPNLLKGRLNSKMSGLGTMKNIMY